jgi:exodeoxyribonuclease III
MRIASWNVNSLNVRMPHLEQWLKDRAPDVVALQETKLEDTKFPQQVLSDAGWHSVFAGQKTYNGVALLSREPVTDLCVGIRGFDDEQKRVLAATVGDIRIVDLYVVNGQSVGSEKYEYKLRWLRACTAWLVEERAKYPNLVVLGDFNVAPDERDVHDPAIWNEHSIHSSTGERAALREMMSTVGLHDSFRLHSADAGQYSWWDYRAGAFRRNHGLRIDLVLVSDALKSRCRASVIDREPRTWERPSDHAPVWVELD